MNSIGVILLEIESILSNWKSVHECDDINEANGNLQLIISRFVSHQLFSELSILIKPFRLKELANQKALITACEETLTSNTARKVESPVISRWRHLFDFNNSYISPSIELALFVCLMAGCKHFLTYLKAFSSIKP